MSLPETAAARLPAAAELPAEFDHAAYVAHPGNADLHGLDADEAWHHYDAFGRAEGRPGSQIDGRAAFLALIPAEGPLLEIGPSWRPCLQPGDQPKERQVRSLDVFTTEELRRLAASQGADPAGVPTIDFVWHGQPYRELTAERFAAAVAAHSLEHQPCLITHLTEVASVLRFGASGARYFLILCDRRFGARHYLADSTLCDVLAAYAARRTRHAACSVLADRLMTTHDNAAEHWAGRHGPDPRQRAPDHRLRDEIAAAIRATRAAPGYLDAHAWNFTPDSFRYLVDTLATVGLSPFRTERIYRTARPDGEFYAVLRVAA